jgi:hypothetical protein
MNFIVNNGDWILTSEHSVSERKKEEKKRKKRKKRKERERERERERAQMGEIDFADTQTEEREKMTFFTFLD